MMENIYRVVSSDNPAQFEAQLNRAVAEGYMVSHFTTYLNPGNGTVWHSALLLNNNMMMQTLVDSAQMVMKQVEKDWPE